MRIAVAGWAKGPPALEWEAIVCANNNCRNLTFNLNVCRWESSGPNTVIHPFRLLPPSSARPQPDFIPEAIRTDYYEACAIASLSPKASATLARRCIQGMIRDFCGIARNRLIDEIRDLKKAVDEGKAPTGVQADTLEAIDAVRSIGNIGAHMEKDVNEIIDVDPDEARILIGLIEMLFSEWYVARDIRQKRIAAIVKVADEKKAAKGS
jgi:hypothetical protein